MNKQKKDRLLAGSLSMYWKLFTLTFSLSACTFGGGFVIISMIKRRLVEELHWFSEEEMLDMTAIAQSAPGALGVNIAVVVGYRLKKFSGALVCALGAVLPPLIILSILSLCYNQFRKNHYVAIALQVMRAGVAAVIFDVVLSLIRNILKTKSIFFILLMLSAFLATVFFDVSAIAILLFCGTAGFLNTRLKTRKE
ncbi:MAG: chromate transporter [Oscillospiraceae bacterium]|nr:chromate transporter [Oscillospiraceae bacterium]